LIFLHENSIVKKYYKEGAQFMQTEKLTTDKMIMMMCGNSMCGMCMRMRVTEYGRRRLQS
jgi:molybdenum cofactor biosynthesis enzyme MoaA